MNIIFRLLELPGIYNLVQSLAGIGGMYQVQMCFVEFIDTHVYDSVLELGCGTGKWSVTHYKQFIRGDINDNYFPSDSPLGMEFKVVDATDLSCFPDNSFDLVYSMGLYHHVSDESVLASLTESARVLRAGGKIAVFDAIIPTSRYNVPGWIMRKLDRGRWVRSQAHMASLLQQASLITRRFKRCCWGPGLEGCFFEAVPTRNATQRASAPPGLFRESRVPPSYGLIQE